MCTFAIKPTGTKFRRVAIDEARKDLARRRGQLYLEFARLKFDQRDLVAALNVVEEGKILTQGPFYLAVRDQLDDLGIEIVAQMYLESAADRLTV